MDLRCDAVERQDLLRIYLNDHLMGAAGAISLLKRSLKSNQGTELGAFLEGLLGEVTEDRRALEDLMAALGVRPDRLKLVAATVGERFGRAKLNGCLLGYSPLSRLVELEGLRAAGTLKLSLWQLLRHLASTDPRLAAADFDALIARAESQLERVEGHRRQAAGRAFLEQEAATGQL